MNKKIKITVACALLTVFAFTLTGLVFGTKVSNVNRNVQELYREIEPLSVSERKESFRQMTSREKSDIFKFHLQIQLDTRSQLNAEQRTLIKESMDFLSPEIYEINKNSAEWNKIKKILLDYESRAKSVFTRFEASEIFGILGKSDPNGCQAAQVTINFKPSCECNGDYISACSRGCLKPDPDREACWYAVEGCGPFWIFECNSVCHYDGPGVDVPPGINPEPTPLDYSK